jgi:hypothetical protein
VRRLYKSFGVKGLRILGALRLADWQTFPGVNKKRNVFTTNSTAAQNGTKLPVLGMLDPGDEGIMRLLSAGNYHWTRRYIPEDLNLQQQRYFNCIICCL